MTDATERARLSRRADVGRDRLLRIVDTLIDRKPIEHVERRAMQIGIPIAAVLVLGTAGALVLSYRRYERDHPWRARSRSKRMPVHLEIARGVLVSVATFLLATYAKKLIARAVTRRR